MNYWQRLRVFRLFSNERRMERYKCIYVWKSLNSVVPSLGLKWNSSVSRNGSCLMYPKVIGPEGHVRTLQRNSINWEGVRLYNSLPEEVRIWNGSLMFLK